MRTHDDLMRDIANNSTGLAGTRRREVDDEHEDDEQRHKKTRIVHPSQRICYDWMVVSGNCHYARDAASFSTYRPAHATLQHNVFNPQDELQVAGIGTVHVTVTRGRNDPTAHVLVLEGVLHIPEAVCNGFNPLLVGSSMSCHQALWEGADATGQPMWYGLPFAGGTRLVLAGNPRGDSELIEGRYYTLSLYVSPEERADIIKSTGG
ncbi:hypothetical protein ARAM_006495 [Aspergillus rambellii]|uniref:Uncharacterized protein n=1 Tax=Aspergillus rambellii TaxID=308745 RepID=A0A0F8V5S1_9EURO|nr:hypothetical protein ARAM_006495 [Aspergillus rambellii]